MRSGGSHTVEDDAVAELIAKTLARKPKAATHWSVRAMVEETGIAKSTGTACRNSSVCYLIDPRLKLSTDRFFVEKLRDVVGLYLDPPDQAVVPCGDEKSQIQAGTYPIGRAPRSIAVKTPSVQLFLQERLADRGESSPQNPH
jgi:putative transposase